MLAGVGVLVVGLALVPGSPTTAAVDRPVGPAVTLVTGDRVVLSSAHATNARVIPGRGRSHIRFQTRRTGGHLYVVPSDARPLLTSGRLDRRLFDVTGLLAAKYDDAHRPTLPLIVTRRGADRRSSGWTGLVDDLARTVRDLPAVGGSALSVGKRDAGRFWRGRASAAVDRIWLDGVRQPYLDKSVSRIGAPAAWKTGLTGTGVTVAVLDTGIDDRHPDLAGRVVAARNFTTEPPGDKLGHGTHVAATIAGTGAASDGRYRGVASGAKLLDGKICEEFGCSDSAILEGLHWATEEQHAKVVNLSLGAPDTPGTDPVEKAINDLTLRTGTLFVVAAGNQGPAAGTVGSPATAGRALAVAAVDGNDAPAGFSSRGPRVGDDLLKPELSAPGVGVVAARAVGTLLDEPVNKRYTRASGTSMAAPHVAGAAALLLQQHPDLTAAELREVLMASADPLHARDVSRLGAGRVDVAQAIRQQVTTTPASLSFGVQRWSPADLRITRLLTYHNRGTRPVVLTLDARFSDPRGDPAPPDALSLGTSRTIVPPGGDARISVALSTGHAGPNGAYTGRITATTRPVTGETSTGKRVTGRASTVVTPLAAGKKSESDT